MSSLIIIFNYKQFFINVKMSENCHIERTQTLKKKI